MKQVIRIAVLMLGLAGVYASAAVSQAPPPDGGVLEGKPPAVTAGYK